MAKPSAAQLRARRLFVQRFGRKKKNPQGHRRRKSMRRDAFIRRVEHETKTGPWSTAISRARRVRGGRNLPILRHNAEGEGHEKKGRSWLPILLIGGAAFFLLRGSALGGIFGGSLGAPPGYTAVGTDASGHPIYQGPVGSAPPAGYIQTGTSANGQPVYSYSGSGVSSLIGIAGPVVGGVSGAITALGKLFGTSSGAVPVTSISPGAPVNFTPGVMIPVKDANGNTTGYYKYDSATGTTTEYDTAGNITGVTSPSYGPGAGAGSIPDTSIPNLTTPDLSPPPAADLSTWLMGGADTTSPFDLVPSLSLDLSVPGGPVDVVTELENIFGSAIGPDLSNIFAV